MPSSLEQLREKESSIVKKISELEKVENKTEETFKEIVQNYSELSQTRAEIVQALESADPLSVDIEKRVQEARKEEKQKLYSKIEEGEKVREELTKAIKEKEESLKTLSDEVEGLKKQSSEGDTSGMTDDQINQILDKALEKYQADAENAIKEIKSTYETKLSELHKKLNDSEVQAHKEKLLAQFGDEIIPEMIKGNTIEELEESATVARQAYLRISERTKKLSADSLESDHLRRNPRTPPSTLDSLREDTKGDNPALDADAIRRMSPDEWREHRKKLGFR